MTSKKPIYVTSIDNEKFAKVEQVVATPIVWAIVVICGGIFSLFLVLAMAFGILYL